ncbi:unnamed protein product [Arabidopsis lyrata]|uniref:Predicted protein n=1 Tax=Arabidopsis lyrata subsp. lyrata TaxID=81972 RepID=D7KCX5_ARALL|nr:predicted protein [Arabidopsis lyrata subsp. lyrata]CAH8253791.1 unnamed protein product [Arabidopsis lyrata]
MYQLEIRYITYSVGRMPPLTNLVSRGNCTSGTRRVEGALLHIQRHGISKFNCTDHEPVIVDEILMDKEVIKDVRIINTLEEAFQRLPKQPIGADLIHYSGMGTPGKIISYGPKTHGSLFQGYHSVIITFLERIGKELVTEAYLAKVEEFAKLKQKQVKSSDIQRQLNTCVISSSHFMCRHVGPALHQF